MNWELLANEVLIWLGLDHSQCYLHAYFHASLTWLLNCPFCCRSPVEVYNLLASLPNSNLSCSDDDCGGLELRRNETIYVVKRQKTS